MLNRVSRSSSVVLVTALPLAAFILATTGGCSAAPRGEGEPTATSREALTASDAVARAQQWVAASLQYCQSPYGQPDPDNSCWSQPWEMNDRCYRTENPAWDPYRSDCSALVSWAWGLPAPGRVTGEFSPFQNDITESISADQLAPGDAVNNSDHVMLFVDWVTQGSQATFIEEPGCATSITHAHQFTSSVSISGTSIAVSYVGMTFTAIRYLGFTSGGGSSSGGSSGSSSGGTGNCVAGGLYCGGDKVSGDPNTLYKCTSGSAGTVVMQCPNGCSVNPGVDDSCKAGTGSSSGSSSGGSSGGGSGSSSGGSGTSGGSGGGASSDAGSGGPTPGTDGGGVGVGSSSGTSAGGSSGSNDNGGPSADAGDGWNPSSSGGGCSMGGRRTPEGLVVIAFGLVAMAGRRRRRVYRG